MMRKCINCRHRNGFRCEYKNIYMHYIAIWECWCRHWARTVNQMEYKSNVKVFVDSKGGNPVVIEGPLVRASWVNLGEGLYGDYNSDDPEDVNLLRFDIEIRNENAWEVVEDASYCTMVEATTPVSRLIKLLMSIYEEYRNVLENDREQSVKKLGETLSHIHAYEGEE